MKKVPHWIQKVIYFTQKFNNAEIRNELLDELITGKFDNDKFVQLCKDCHIAFYINGMQIKDDSSCGAYLNKWEAIEAAGKEGTIKSMQGVLHEYFNN